MAYDQRFSVQAQRLVLCDWVGPITPEMVKSACTKLDARQWDVLRLRWELDVDIMNIFNSTPKRNTRELGRLLSMRRKDIRFLEVNAIANVRARLELAAMRR